MSDIEPHKLKVTELRDELKKRGLDTKGKKEHLVKRLLQALGMDDAGADDSQTNIDDSDVSQLCDVSVTAGDVTASCDDVKDQHATDTANGCDTATAAHSSDCASAEPLNTDLEGSTKEADPELAASGEQSVASGKQGIAGLVGDGCTSKSVAEPISSPQTGQTDSVRPADSETDVDMAPAAVESSAEPTTGSAQCMLPASESSSVSTLLSPQSTEEALPAATEDSTASHADLEAAGDRVTAGEDTGKTAVEDTAEDTGKAAVDKTAEDTGKAVLALACGDGEQVAADEHEPDEKMEQDEEAPVPVQENLSTNSVSTNVVVEEGSSSSRAYEKDSKEEAVKKIGSGDLQLPTSRERSRSPRRRSRSPVQQRQRSPQNVRSADDESWILSEEVQLDRYNSDLNMVIKDNYTAVPLCQAGFAYMWASAKATYGVTSGKVAFEFKVTDEPHVDLPADETFPHVARVGWSIDSGSTQLGEDSTSWGYGGTGKASHDNTFKYYGQSFAKGDVITAYLDIDSSPVVLSFSKNGEDLGVAYEIEKSLLKGQALFPTFLSKNMEFTVNFGHQEAAFPLREGYTFIGRVPSEQRVRAGLPPAKKSDAEVLMLVGLPAAGKTFWAAKQCQAHPEKRYNVLGTNAIIDKMKVPLDMISVRKIKVYFNRELLDLRREKRMLERRFKKKQDVATGATYKIVVAEYKAKIKRVMGLQRKYNYSGRWDVLFDRSNQCLLKLMELASSKRRNYIIDQTNVYGTAQRRKMSSFEGFRRKAVIVVPSDDEFISRTVKRTKEEGKQVPDDAVLEMKANFSIPSVNEVFDEIIFAELPEADARKLVAQYIKEGQVKFPPGARRFNDRRQGPEQQADRGGRDAGRGRGHTGPRDGFRNDKPDKPGYGSSHRSAEDSGSSRGFGNNRYEDRNPRPDRGYYPVQSPSSGSKGFGGGQDAHYGRSGSYSASTKPNISATQPPGGSSWAVGSGRPSAPTSGSSFVSSPGGSWRTGNQPQQAGWGNNYGASSGATGGNASVGQASSYGNGYRAQPASQDTQSSDYSTRSDGHPTQSIGYGARANSYGAPTGGYGAQASSHGAPAGGYGASASSRGASAGGYGASAGSYGASAGGYGAQASSHGAPAGGYGVSASSRGASAEGYGASAGGYGASAGGAPAGGYGAQASSRGAPAGGYSVQAGSQGAQAGGYGAQTSSYGTQSGGYSTQSGSISTQPGGYDSQSRGYGVQTGSYGNQARSSANQAGGYGSPVGSYSNQAGSSSSQGRSYGSTTGYGQSQGTSASWPSQQQSLPPSRPQATTAPQWSQQQASGTPSWQQSSYSQRR